MAGISLGYGGVFAGTFEDNIDQDPGFLVPTGGDGLLPTPFSYDWRLSVVSPNLNRGTHKQVEYLLPETDCGNSMRIRYGTIDIGAHEKMIPDISVSGTMVIDTLLIADTIKVTDHVIIDDDITLTIAPGCVLQFMGNYKLEVVGTLLATGMEEFPILFTMQDTTGLSSEATQEGGWQGIIIDNAERSGVMHDNDTSRIEYCIIEYVKTKDNYWSGPISTKYFSKLIISNNIIRNNRVFNGSGGIYCDNSEVLIRNNIIENNRVLPGVPSYLNCSGGLSLSKCQGIVDNNIIKGNYSSSKPGGILSASSKLIFSGNTIQNNYAEADAGAVYHWYSEDTLINNTISNNNSPNGLSLWFVSSPSVLVGNLICNNNYGVVGYLSDLILVNNTIANNKHAGMMFTDGDPTIVNCIFTGNGPQLNLQTPADHTILKNCLIEGGLSGIYGSFNGDIQNVLDHEPHFVNPTPDNGIEHSGTDADFSVHSFSRGINNGTADFSELLPLTDINGNLRVYRNRIDIGAFENQDAPPEITKHPFGGKYCSGDTLELFCAAADTALYQWMKDGQLLPGKNARSLIIESVSSADEGNYYCAISNAYDTLETVPAYIDYNQSPQILSDPRDAWTVENREMDLSVSATGENLEYQWFFNDLPIPGAVTSDLRFSIPDSSGEGKYSSMVSNDCAIANSEPADVLLVPQICMVTVSPTTGHNLVVWEKRSKAPLTAYNIYRESAAAGIYDRLATIPYDDLSVLVDTSADPTVQAYLYKITAIDTSGFETDIDLCKPHKTIHLLVTTNPELNTTQLAWDRYYGFEYQTYTIYRSSTGLNFDPVHSMSASLNSWTDPDASTGDLFYRIAVEKPDPCVAADGSKKAGTGPYVHSLSNLDDNKLKAGENPPDSLFLDNNSIDENMLPGSLIGRIVTIDLDTLDAYTYQLVSGEGDDDNSSFSIIGDLLISAASFDYETKASYYVRIRTTDNSAYYLEKSFVILINDTHEGTGTSGETPPDSIYLDNLSIAENNNFGDPIGMLITADKDVSDVHSYMLVNGSGDDDNIMFMITGSVLRAGFSYDYESRSQYTVRVRSTDLGGNQIERIFIIVITDVDETVGIEGKLAGAVQVYPNPFSHTTTISFPNQELQSYKMVLTDISGKICRMEKNISGSSYQLDRRKLSKGIYFIEMKGPQIFRGKIIIE